jgi:membrane protease YdiL (CAAX protease family)
MAILRAVIVGLLVGMVAANVWPILLLKLSMPAAAGAEVLFLFLYILYARGGGPPGAWKPVRGKSFRSRTLSGADWVWGFIGAVAFAATVHAAIVVLFRLVPFPAAAFHQGYDLSMIPGQPMRWLAVVISAASAGICEETGFRGYMQAPIEKRHGAFVAILISSFFFMLLHLTKSWALIGMVPIVFGAGILLGLLAWSSRSLVFCIIGHTIMDIGLFAYWWTQIAGTFSQRPISETGMDQAFYVECGVLAAALIVTVVSIARFRKLSK